MSSALYLYYDYDGTPCRMQLDRETGLVVLTEGYFKGRGFHIVEHYPVEHQGEPISESEFKKKVISLRR